MYRAGLSRLLFTLHFGSFLAVLVALGCTEPSVASPGQSASTPHIEAASGGSQEATSVEASPSATPQADRQSKTAALGDFVIEDMFGRRLNERGIVLVDWDGQIANPAVKLVIRPPANAAFPIQGLLTASHPRLYFNSASRRFADFVWKTEVGKDGPKRTFTIADKSGSWTGYVAVFPDRDTEDEEHALSIVLKDKAGREIPQELRVRVIDQDRAGPPVFQVTVNSSHDKTGFFGDERVRSTAVQAANDWAYFFDDMKLDEVPPDSELYWTHNPDFETGEYSRNEKSFRGFFLNIYGVRSDKYLKSGGNVSPEGLQTSEGVELPLRRSGAVGIETAGNFNKLGWILTAVDDEWWMADYRNDLPTDLYSIAMHEIGHSLLFNPGHPGFARFQKDGVDGSVDDPQVVAYHGKEAYLHASSHLVGSVDRLSKKGSFGFGEAGTDKYKGIIMPPRRWLITKLDLLVAQAAGYKLRPTSAFVPLSLTTSSLPDATVAAPYRQTLQASGGIPAYYWAIESGDLPKGLTLDSFTGVVTGVAEESGSFHFVVRLRDGDDTHPGVTLPASITVRNP